MQLKVYKRPNKKEARKAIKTLVMNVNGLMDLTEKRFTSDCNYICKWSLIFQTSHHLPNLIIPNLIREEKKTKMVSFLRLITPLTNMNDGSRADQSMIY